MDASVEDVVTEDNLESAIAFVKDLSARDGAIVAVTGAIDLVADAERCYVIRNGRPEMGKVTGTGCQLSALTAAYVAANPGNCLEAAAAAVCLMGLAGEIGFSRMALGTATPLTAAASSTRSVIWTAGSWKGGQNMRCDKKDLLLYAVTDRSWLNGATLYEQVEAALRGGATFIQLREKALDQEHFLAEARELKTLCRRFGVPFLINDNVEIAAAVDADGVHVGQSDMEAGDVRARLGADKIIGVSAQTVEQALLAQQRGADYLGVGAVFPTGTKQDATDVPYETLRDICRAVDIPVIAIGGINRGNVRQLAGSGICGVAVVSAIFAQKQIEAATADLKAAVERMVNT